MNIIGICDEQFCQNYPEKETSNLCEYFHISGYYRRYLAFLQMTLQDYQPIGLQYDIKQYRYIIDILKPIGGLSNDWHKSLLFYFGDSWFWRGGSRKRLIIDPGTDKFRSSSKKMIRE